MEKRLEALMNELSDIANSYAGDKTGTEASLLHLASGNIQTVLASLNGKQSLNTDEVVERYTNWNFNLFLLKNL